VAQPLAIASLNSEFLPLAEVRISPLDRGFLFGDAVYEVIPVYGGAPLLLDAHVARLNRSLGAIDIRNPHSDDEWRQFLTELIERNGGGTMAIYVQVSRGAEASRDHVYLQNIRPTVFAMAAEIDAHDYADGVKAITRPDERWDRCDIKTTSLLANILARQKAVEAGAIEAILIDNGHVTEGGASSVIIVENRTLVRRPHGTEVLPGTTTDHVVALAGEAGYACREELVTLERLLAADEVWLTSATKGIAPVVRVDEQIIGSGRPGPVWTAVYQLYETRLHD